MAKKVTLTVIRDSQKISVDVPKGINLRDVLLALDLTPYAWVARQANCGGRGLCATCGVIMGDGPAPTHWHDKLAQRFGYPRLSCQVQVDESMTIQIMTDKKVWGGRNRKLQKGPT